MQIDWFTLVAQVVNFGILVLLLKRFLYTPITRAMEARESKISQRLRDAEEAREEAEEEAAAYRKKQASLEKEREDTLKKASEEAGERRKELLRQAREEVSQKERQWRESVEAEREGFLEALQREIPERFCRALRRALEDMADRELERSSVSVFLERLDGLDDDAREDLQDAVREVDAVSVTTAFELSDEDRKRVEERVREQLDTDVDVAFEQSSDVVWGIELSAGGRQVAWSARQYVQRLHEAMGRELDRLREQDDGGGDADEDSGTQDEGQGCEETQSPRTAPEGAEDKEAGEGRSE